ncbi:adhesin [Streptomyces yaizuensis]|uniref:Adhesin n=1 Tax=Streptomyces yaizuensis TaxID=2989713 RepID=A0ABQ5P4E0_9ACTN|nr:adhesin [Streptomyces sp. YSPA8]GLF97387.1 adhesin [Streptomyces sp. YSPA8]
MARETMLGRFSLLSRTGKILLVGGVVLTALALAASVVTLRGGDPARSKSTGSAGEPGLLPDGLGDLGGLGGVPQRIEPSPPTGRTAGGSSPGDRAGDAGGGTGSGAAPGAERGERQRPPRPTASTAPGPPPAQRSSSATLPGDGGAPTPQASARRSAHPLRPAYSAWAGPGCSGGGQYREHGRYLDGDEGWYSRPGGGHQGNGCDGRFSAVPMSGHDDRDGGGSATWSWDVGTGYRECSLTVVVPEGEHDRDVAGAPSVYQVSAGGGGTLQTFRVDQRALRGTRAQVHGLRVSEGTLTVRLLDRGRDWGGGREGAHHAAAQMRADCRPAA